jgi:hypothetical protein
MARSASKGIFPRSGIVDGHIITHPNGKRYQWNSSKGVWKLKSTMIDDSNFIGPQGIPGPTGPQGPTGPEAENKLSNSTTTFGKVYHGHIGDYSTYVESVLTLFPLDQIDGNNCHVSGKFRAWRSNGCCSDVNNIWEGMIHKNYDSGANGVYTVSGFSYSLQHYNNMPVCTFTYNGRPWLGIRLDEGLPHWAAISFTGFASNAHFGEVIKYYDTRGTVINAEINNSITNQGITTSTY